MTQIKVVKRDGSEKEFTATEGLSLMEALRDEGFEVRYIKAKNTVAGLQEI